jgi:hypothetical protein
LNTKNDEWRSVDIIKTEFLISLFAYNFCVKPEVLYAYDDSVKCAIYIATTLILLTWEFTCRNKNFHTEISHYFLERRNKGVFWLLTYFNLPQIIFNKMAK